MLSKNALFAYQQDTNALHRYNQDGPNHVGLGTYMQGLELARMFYEEHQEQLLDGIPELVRQRASIGLVGEGSECFGLDDVYSRDHDWGAGFCIWLSTGDFQECGARFKSNYERLCMGDFHGYPIRNPTIAQGVQRLGVFSSDAFYQQLIGTSHAPDSNEEWLLLSETSLAAATNGALFQSGDSGFTEMRKKLLRYYPEDLCLKKIASCCLIMAQSGQYNFPRETDRGDYIAAFQALDRFIEASMSLVYILNKRFRPYYKWAHRCLGTLPHLGIDVHDNVTILVDRFQERNYANALDCIEKICVCVVEELHRRKLTDSFDPFLMPQALQVNTRIKDNGFRAKPIPISISL